MSNKPIKQFTDQNRIAWEEVNHYHQQAKQKVKERFRAEPEFLALDRHLKARLSELGISGKSLLHLMCNDGEELMSAKRMGAERCIGIDISSTAIDSANELAKQLGLENVSFKQSDAYDVDIQMLDNRPFDIAMTTVGALCWLPDLSLFFRRLNSFLATGAKVLIHEIHPVSYLLDDELNLRSD
ncbi:MAG: methyltransferase domain-containing protein, partial [Calditrichota bacterium]